MTMHMGAARERKGHGGGELMDNAIRPYDKDVFYFIYQIMNYF
jgi:hypothetical protein